MEEQVDEIQQLLAGAEAGNYALEAANRKLAEAEAKVTLLKQQLTQEVQEVTRLSIETGELRHQLEDQRKLAERQLEESLLKERKEVHAEVQGLREQVQLLQPLAYHDPVTGLPNRNLGLRFLEQELQRAAQGNGSLLFAVLDPEQLDPVNRHFGRAAGDELLRQLGERLKTGLGPEDGLVRGREDELWVIFPCAKEARVGLDRASKALQAFLGSLKTPFPVGPGKLSMAVTCGLVAATGQESPDRLLEMADLARAAGKKDGLNRLSLFRPELETAVDTQLAGLLRQGLADKAFALRFQPIYDLKTRQMWGVETFLRWNHPTRGVQEPEVFMPTLLTEGLFLEVGDWALREACQLSKTIRELPVTINLPIQELMQGDFVRRFTLAIQTAQLPRPDGLVVEVQESDLDFANQPLLAALRELRRWNVQLAVDGFRHEKNALARLARLQVNYLKTHPAWTADCEQGSARTRLKHLVAAAESEGMKVIADGVETTMQRDALGEIGCPLAQGDALCPPIPWGDLHDKIKNRRGL